jgi:glycerol kinase
LKIFTRRNFQKEVEQLFPEPGYVEMNPREIYRTTVECIEEACAKLQSQHGIGPEQIRALGISNQRGALLL